MTNNLAIADRQAYERMLRKEQEREYRKVRKEIKRNPLVCGSLNR